MSVLRVACLALAGLLAAGPLSAGAAPAAPRPLEGESAWAAGDLEGAVARFSASAAAAEAAGDATGESRALTRLGETLHALGRYREAREVLQRALSRAEAAQDASRRAAALGALGNVAIVLGPPEQASRQLEQAAALARESADPELAAAILVNLGNQRAFGGDTPGAFASYREAAAFAKRADAKGLEATALANAGRAAFELGEGAATHLAPALELALALPDAHDTSYLLTNLGLSWMRLAEREPSQARSHLREAYRALERAASSADEIGDARASSWAWGGLGELYESRGRHAEALELTGRALEAARRVGAPDSLYRWQWQAGRQLAAIGRQAEAAEAYGAAVETLQGIRPELGHRYAGGSVFEDVLRPVYFGRVNLLLGLARGAADAAKRQQHLRDARETLELLKAAELSDYFQDDCVAELQAKIRPLDEVGGGAVIVYPILLDDRIEFIVSFAGRLEQYEVAVGREALTEEVHAFRSLLEKRITHQYLPHAKQLYRWLVEPYAKRLREENATTLVVVPDGPLRSIPLAALHDGEGFLIERYAVAMTPGLDLTDPQPLDRAQARALLGGLSIADAPLPYVKQELAALNELVPADLLIDEGFRREALQSQLENQQITIVHIATHGKFEAEAADSFLETYGGKISLDQLSEAVGLFRFRERPLELLTLSACETAAGDDRAALGLAGVAVKAGARSVLATLWSVSDLAAMELVTEFYRQLGDERNSRAVALQRAQAKLLSQPDLAHPGYWSAFLLISSWL